MDSDMRDTTPRPSFAFPVPPPRTPEPVAPAQPMEPHAPRDVPKFRLRRRRHVADDLSLRAAADDVPLIHFSHHGSVDFSAPQPHDASMLSPRLPVFGQHVGQFITPTSPPRTPISQIQGFDGMNTERDYDWGMTPKAAPERPASALSVFSDSSASSVSSSNSSPSFGESCTSADSDAGDAFCFPDSKSRGLASPVSLSSKPRKRIKTSHRVKWTPDMDEHLWKTYLAYQTDPEVTPFKALPGVAPPLGVCHRVAREAKRSWKGSRAPLSSIAEDSYGSIDALMRESSAPPANIAREGTPDTITEATPRSRSASDVRPSLQPWPRSEASTRRRLRELCKRKPHLPPHYQRLLASRSPSPFGSSSAGSAAGSSAGHPRRPSRSSGSPARDTGSASFQTADLKLSLAANTMSSMQPGSALFALSSEAARDAADRDAGDAPLPAPLARVPFARTFAASSDAHDHPHAHAPPPAAGRRPFATWAPSASRAVHQKSFSLQAELGMGHYTQGHGHGHSHTHGYRSMRCFSSSRYHYPSISDDVFAAPPLQAPPPLPLFSAAAASSSSSSSSALAPAADLESEPWKIHAPQPMSGSMKRRAQYPLGEELLANDQDAARGLQDLFRNDQGAGPSTTTSTLDGHRRVRSRGFSLGAAGQGSGPTHARGRQLADLFNAQPPPVQPGPALAGPALPALAPPTSPVLPSIETPSPDAPRLRQHRHLPSLPGSSPPQMQYQMPNLLPQPLNQPPPRLRSPFSPFGPAAVPSTSMASSTAPGFTKTTGKGNTFPRSMFRSGRDMDRLPLPLMMEHAAAGHAGHAGNTHAHDDDAHNMDVSDAEH